MGRDCSPQQHAQQTAWENTPSCGFPSLYHMDGPARSDVDGKQGEERVLALLSALWSTMIWSELAR